MTALTLFDVPLARNTDPQTSHLSACLHVWDYDLNARGRQVTVWSLDPRPEHAPLVELVRVDSDVL